MMNVLVEMGKLMSGGQGWRVVVIVFCGLLAGCHRAPQTAAELQKVLPHQYRGELHQQGEQQSRIIVVEPHDFTVRDEHLLEFNRVRYQLLSGSEVTAAGDAQIRGTISTPGLVLHLDEVGGTPDVDGGDVLKAGTFQGTLSGDLQKLEATWQSGFGQAVTLRVLAVP